MQSVIGQFRKKRALFPLQELRRYQGQWVAFSEDGLRIVASGQEIEELADRVKAAGEDLQNVFVERIDLDSEEIFIGGAEQL